MQYILHVSLLTIETKLLMIYLITQSFEPSD